MEGWEYVKHHNSFTECLLYARHFARFCRIYKDSLLHFGAPFFSSPGPSKMELDSLIVFGSGLQVLIDPTMDLAWERVQEKLEI